MDGLPLGAITNGVGVIGLVVLVGWLVWSGRLVPKSTHEAHVALLNQRNDAQVALLNQQLEDERHEKGEWRTECRIKDQTIGELTEQNRAIKAVSETLADFLQGLRRAGIGPAPEKKDES